MGAAAQRQDLHHLRRRRRHRRRRRPLITMRSPHARAMRWLRRSRVPAVTCVLLIVMVALPALPTCLQVQKPSRNVLSKISRATNTALSCVVSPLGAHLVPHAPGLAASSGFAFILPRATAMIILS